MMSLRNERLRSARALEVLEFIGNAEAKELLQRLSGGEPGTWLTREAQASLSRLRRVRGSGFGVQKSEVRQDSSVGAQGHRVRPSGTQ